MLFPGNKITAAAMVGAALLGASPASAAAPIFAEYKSDRNGTIFVKSDGTNGSMSANAPVTFISLSDVGLTPNPTDGGATQYADATFTFHATASSPVNWLDVNAAGEAFSQLYSGVMSFTLNSAVGGYAAGTNLLTVTFTDAVFSGRSSYGPVNPAQLSMIFPDNTNNMTSDVFNFATLPGVGQRFDIAFSNSPAGNGEGGFKTSWGGDSGTFAALTQSAGAVPEPATWAMMIFGFGLVGASLRRRGQNAVLA